ncbi:hypothetical protein BGZ81_006095 [Podila clonocystis]|nr:hypothetical protein BGZ81_006095 [Podila clonocystis]
MKVNRLFYNALLPLLWSAYDETAEGSEWIPHDTLLDHARHLRYLILYSKYERSLQFSVRLLLATQQLQCLRWGFSYSNEGEIGLPYAEIQPAATALSSLKMMHLLDLNQSGFNFLAEILTHNLQLQVLETHGLLNVRSMDGCRPLLNLQSLDLGNGWADNPGLVQLLRLCPNIEKLALWVDDECPIVEIAQNLRECCPRLTTLERVVTESTDALIWSQEKDMALAQETTGLVSFYVPLTTLSAGVRQSLVDRHASTLVRLVLDVTLLDADTFANVNMILVSCVNLEEFRLDMNQPVTARILEMVGQPWKCEKLRLFEVMCVARDALLDTEYEEEMDEGGVSEPFECDPDDDDDMESFVGAVDRDEDMGKDKDEGTRSKFLAKHGWRVFRDPNPTGYVIIGTRYINDFVKKLLRQAVVLPELEDVYLNEFCYRKNGSC